MADVGCDVQFGSHAGASGREYECQRCGRAVVVCSICDHGNRYCSAECARAARGESQRAASRRYQKTPQGALNHAARQARYRANVAAAEESDSSRLASPASASRFEGSGGSVLVSPGEIPAVGSRAGSAAGEANLGMTSTGLRRCHFCGSLCGPEISTGAPWGGRRWSTRTSRGP